MEVKIGGGGGRSEDGEKERWRRRELLFDDGLTFERGARRRKAQWDFSKRERRSCELVGRVERGER